MKNFLKRGKKLYWWLIGTFAVLYLAVAFVSTLHAITFFQLANSLGLAILLGAAYEVGQATVLFSILMSQNRNRFLAWAMMFLLTGLQVTANVYASFKFMVEPATATTDWTYWQRAILFGVQAENDEMYQVIISWISGALLPLVALGMTALVADNIKLATGKTEVIAKKEEEDEEDDKPLFGNPFKKKKKGEPTIEDAEEEAEEDPKMKALREEMEKLRKENEKTSTYPYQLETKSETLKEPIVIDLQERPDNLLKDIQPIDPQLGTSDERKMEMPIKEAQIMEEVGKRTIEAFDIKPVNKMRGWHLFDEYVDDEHNIFKKGKFIGHDSTKTPTSKKA